MFHQRVEKYIAQCGLLKPTNRVLVALSGGADSVALLRVLLRLGYHCQAAHCNFSLRGEESDGDEQFVRTLCQLNQVPLEVIRFDTQGYAATHKLSIEMAARELRYDWFETLRAQLGIDVVAVGHHRDDSVETLLLNLIRGTGIHGLKGISPKQGAIVRPLLGESKEAVVAYLEGLNQPYVTDSTNLQDEYTRNKIRLNLLPLLGEFNPSISHTLAETAQRLFEVDRIYTAAIEEAKERVCDAQGICIERLLKEVSPAAVLFECLHPLGFNSAQVKELFRSLTAQAGARFASAGWEVVRDRTHLLLQSIAEKRVQEQLPSLETEVVTVGPDFLIPREKSVACLDANRVSLPLVLRRWKQGDSFTPLGMKGRKKVSDYLNDRKLSAFNRERQCVVCTEDGKIVWLVNERCAHQYRVTEQTKRVLLLRVSD